MTKQEQFENVRDNMLKALSDYAHHHGAKSAALFAASIAKGLRDINQEGADAIITSMNEWLATNAQQESTMTTFITVGTYDHNINEFKRLTPADKIAIAQAMFDTPPDEDNLGQLLFYTDLMVSSDGEVLVPFEIAPPTEPEHNFEPSETLEMLDEPEELGDINKLLGGECLVGDGGEILCYTPLPKTVIDALLNTASDDVKQKIANEDYALTEVGVLMIFEQNEGHINQDPYEVEEEPLEEEEACPPTLRDGSAPVEQ